MKISTLSFLFFLAFAFGCMIGIARAQPDVGQDRWTNHDTLRAIENQQQVLLHQQAIDAQRQSEQNLRLRENMYQQQMLNEQRNQTWQLRRMNRGF